MPLVIDFEGFQHPSGKFIVKELAAHAVGTPIYHGRWTFLPPHPFSQLHPKTQLTFSWVYRNFHRMDWDQGDFPYSDLTSILHTLSHSFRTIYVKGLEKKKFLQRIIKREIINLDELNCPRFEDLPTIEELCPYHHNHAFRHCAVKKAAAYTRFLEII